jgi:hypothetical protein
MRRAERSFDNHAKRTAWPRRSRQARGNPVRQPPLDEQGPDLRHAEITLVARTLAHDAQQDRPFAIHQLTVDRTSRALGAIEIRVHVGRDLLQRQPAFESARQVLPLLAEPGEALKFALIDPGSHAEDARTAAMLVQRAIAQRVELRSRPPTP